MKKRIFLFLLMSFTMVLLVQNYLLNKEIDLKETEVISARSPEINYEQYREIFNYMVDNLKIDRYYLMGGDTIPEFIIVEKDLTFNKRSVLNLSDKLNGVDESTQKTLVFENKKNTKQISVTFAFVDTYMDSNMIYYYSPSDFNETTPEMSKKINIVTINYKNIVITVLQNGLSGANPDEISMAIRNVQKQIINSESN